MEEYYVLRLPNGKFYSKAYQTGAPKLRVAMNFPPPRAVAEASVKRMVREAPAVLPPIPPGTQLVRVVATVEET